MASAKAQAKQVLDEATARATAIHDGAERRLNLLMSRHTEAIRRLTEIRDVVTTLVAGEVSRGSLEDEVEKAVANSIAESKAAAGGRPAAQTEGRHAPQGTVSAAAGPAPAAPQAQGVAAQQAPTRGRVDQGRPQPAPAHRLRRPPSQRRRPPSQAQTAPQPAQTAPQPGADGPPVGQAGRGRGQRPAGRGANEPGQAGPAAPRTGNGQRNEADAPRPSGTGEGARHAVGGSRPSGSEE